MRSTGCSAILLALLCSGCGTFAPELRISAKGPAEAKSSLTAAVNFADTTDDSFITLQSEASYTQTTLTLLSLGLATVAASKLIHGNPISSLRDPAIGLGVLSAVDYAFAPRTKRQTLDTGRVALTCAKKAAYAMDAIGDALTGDGAVSAPNPSPVVNLARMAPAGTPAPATALGALAPTTHIAQRAQASSQSVRLYAQSLRATVAPALRAANTEQPSQKLASTLETAADKQDEARTTATAKARSARASAANYLVNTTELIIKMVLEDLHRSDPTPSDIIGKVQSETDARMAGLKKSLADYADTTKDTDQKVKTVAAIAPSAGAVNIAYQVQADKAAAIEAPPADAFGQPTPRTRNRATPAPEAPNVQQKVADATTKADDATTKTDASKSDALTVKELLDVESTCLSSSK